MLCGVVWGYLGKAQAYFFVPPCGRRYVKHSLSPNSESRASASATFASCSQAAECSSSSSLNASLAGCGSPLSDGASRSASSSNGSTHSGTCNETNGLYDGEQPQEFLI